MPRWMMSRVSFGSVCNSRTIRHSNRSMSFSGDSVYPAERGPDQGAKRRSSGVGASNIKRMAPVSWHRCFLILYSKPVLVRHTLSVILHDKKYKYNSCAKKTKMNSPYRLTRESPAHFLTPIERTAPIPPYFDASRKINAPDNSVEKSDLNTFDSINNWPGCNMGSTPNTQPWNIEAKNIIATPTRNPIMANRQYEDAASSQPKGRF